MKPIPYEVALALAKLVDASARQLNDHISQAHNLGMTVEANVVEVRRVTDRTAQPLVEVSTKVRPDQISLTPGLPDPPATEEREPK